jgi:hypothetical protein
MTIFNPIPEPANHRNSGTVIKDDNTPSNIGDLLNASWGPTTKVGIVSMSTSVVTEIKVGTTTLDGRHTLLVTNDSSKLIYIGHSATLSSTNALLLNSGTAARIKLDPNLDQKYYGITFFGLADIRVMEMRS